MESVAWNSDTTAARNRVGSDSMPVSCQLVRARREKEFISLSLAWCGVRCGEAETGEQLARPRHSVQLLRGEWGTPDAMSRLRSRTMRTAWSMSKSVVSLTPVCYKVWPGYDMVRRRGFTLALSWHPHYYPAPGRRERLPRAPCSPLQYYHPRSLPWAQPTESKSFQQPNCNRAIEHWVDWNN